MAGCATRTSFAGHPGRSAKARHALTFKPDHPMGAGQNRMSAAEVKFEHYPAQQLGKAADLLSLTLSGAVDIG